MDEAQLVRQTLAGDKNAFEQLVWRYEKEIYNIAYHYTAQAESAMDITQESFIKAYQALGELQEAAHFGAWLKSICRHGALDYLRRQAKQSELSLEELDEACGYVPRHAGQEPDKIWQSREAVAVLGDILGTLPAVYRETLILRAFEEYSYEQIAQKTNCSVGTVKSRLSRAKAIIREKFSSYERG